MLEIIGMFMLISLGVAAGVVLGSISLILLMSNRRLLNMMVKYSIKLNEALFDNIK